MLPLPTTTTSCYYTAMVTTSWIGRYCLTQRVLNCLINRHAVHYIHFYTNGVIIQNMFNVTLNIACLIVNFLLFDHYMALIIDHSFKI